MPLPFLVIPENAWHVVPTLNGLPGRVGAGSALILLRHMGIHRLRRIDAIRQ